MDYVCVNYNGWKFVIDSCHSLWEVHNCDNKSNDVYIPHKFPTGEIIDIISPYTFRDGEFGTITISDGVRIICDLAFSAVTAEEIVWPSSCTVIGRRAFKRCKVSKISNIDHVNQIGEGAFECSKINSLVWPSACLTIPKNCFYQAEIPEVSNIDCVRTIEECAFEEFKSDCLCWPKLCGIIPRKCFARSALKEIRNLSSVNKVENLAFYKVQTLKSLDFSCSIHLDTEKNSFSKDLLVLLPYYQDT